MTRLPAPRYPAPRYCVALTRTGAATALRLAEKLGAQAVYVPARFAAPGATPFEEPVAALIRRLWDGAGGFLLFMAAGIAVRAAAPCLEGKDRDPALVVFDPEGRFAVPILSGHLGGANALALAAAEALGGIAVLTTATDAAGRPAAEVWARDAGLRVSNPEAVVRVNAAWANNEPVGLFVDPLLNLFSPGGEILPHLELFTRSPEEAAAWTGALLAVTHREGVAPKGALILRPPVLALGVGCRKAADPGAVEQGVLAALEAAGLSPEAVFAVATVDAKKDEPAIQRFAAHLGVPFLTYPAERLKDVDVKNPSARVLEAVGTPSVSEAAALTAAQGGKLLLPKTAGESWTVAVAMKTLEEDT